VKDRLEPFIRFFDEHAELNHIRERLIQYVIIVFAVTIPLINLGAINPISSIISAILGALIAILTAILQFDNFHDNWLSLRSTSSKLKREYYLWREGSEEYSKENIIDIKKEIDNQKDYEERKYTLLIKNCEEILLADASEYINLFSRSRIYNNISSTKNEP